MKFVLRRVLFSSAWLFCRHSFEFRLEQQDQQMTVQEDAFSREEGRKNSTDGALGKWVSR